jgi:SNF2 family DNA or RNA helicase
LLLDRLLKKDLDSGLDFILSADAYRLLIEYRFNPYVLASSTKINIFPHQIDEVIKILDNPRMLIADEVGLGKTIIAALVATELRERGLANKILFVVPKSLVIKWQGELSNRFDTASTIIDSDYLRVNDNPFEHEAFYYVTSMDFLKQQHIMKMIEDCNFDLVIVDEAHKLASGTERFALGELLARRSNYLLFLTATPHNGDDEDFLQRMKLLDPYFHQISTTSHLMTRNIKEDVIDLDGKEVFPPRTSKTIDVDVSEKELRIHKMVDDYINERLEEASNPEERNMVRFLTTVIRKRASSSFYALKNTLQKRLDKLGTSRNIKNSIREMKRNEKENDEEGSERNEEEVIGFTVGSMPKEREEISDILIELENLHQTDSKLQLLTNFIETAKKSDPNAKMVVFSEYRDTMNYLRDRLSGQFKVGSIDGTMNIQERNDALIRFRDTNGSDIMVCTDAAGEGIDMQFCNIEVNYDLPWNPNKLEQRMGRIHRIGQDRSVYYYNFVINDTIDGYIIHRLLDKMESIKNAIGEKIYDVIGKRLVNEEEITNLYEELLRLPKEKWEAKIRQIDGIIEEKRRILNQINELLLGYRLDRTKLEDMKKNIQTVISKDEVKRFVKKYLDTKGGKLEPINLEEEVYRIFLPKQIPIPAGVGTRVLEGSFSSDIAIKKGYTYFALGNPYIMGLVHNAAEPSVAILTHPSHKGVLMIYKIAIRDGKGRERNGKMFAFNLDSNSNVKEIDMKDIWNCEPSSNFVLPCNESDITRYKELIDVYADKNANDLLRETAPRLAEIEYKTEESILRHYSRQVEDVNTKIIEYEQKLAESPNYSKLIEKEKTKRTKLQNDLRTKLEETKRDFDVTPVIELVGIAVIDASNRSDIKSKLERPGMIPHYNDFSKLNQQFNSENSQTTHFRMQRNPEEWIEYHRLYREARKGWKIIPYERMIERIEQISPRFKVGDFGCGEAKIMEALGNDRVYSCDHVALNEKVTACDMRSVPLPDGSLDVIVFSLSLMGKNWIEYISEARRCLWNEGVLLIVETSNALTEGRLFDVRQVLKTQGFSILKEEERDVFTFIEARKEAVSSLSWENTTTAATN